MSDPTPHNQPSGEAGEPKLPPNIPPALAALLAKHRPSEIVRMWRRVTWGVTGCGLVAIAAILLTLYVPYWQTLGEAKSLVERHLTAIRDGKIDDAWRDFIARDSTDLANPNLHRLRAAPFVDALRDGATFTVADARVESGQGCIVSGSLIRADGHTTAFFYRVFHNEEAGAMRIDEFRIGTHP